VVIPRTLTGAPGLNVALGEPWTVEEDDNLVVLHAVESCQCMLPIFNMIAAGLLKHHQMRQYWDCIIVQIDLQAGRKVRFPGK